MTSAAELAGRFRLKRSGAEWRGACPACGYKTGLSVSEKAGKVVFWCASCSATGQAELARVLLGAEGPQGPRPAPVPDAPDPTRLQAAMALWARGLELAPRSPGLAYLAGRRVPPPPGAPLRYLPDAKHPSGARFGCLLALVTDAAGQGAALHRTFLAPGGAGKAKAEPQRMTLGNVRGGAVRLYPVAPRLVIAEGIETALAAAELLKLPAWAAISAGNLGDSLALPPEVREVVIAADHDPPGLAAAARAAARWKAEGRRVQIAKPEKPGTDFNDVLRERMARGG
jgi:putative DNA primase/helicase